MSLENYSDEKKEMELSGTLCISSAVLPLASPLSFVINKIFWNFRVLENEVLGNIFGTKRDEITE